MTLIRIHIRPGKAFKGRRNHKLNIQRVGAAEREGGREDSLFITFPATCTL